MAEPHPIRPRCFPFALPRPLRAAAPPWRVVLSFPACSWPSPDAPLSLPSFPPLPSQPLVPLLSPTPPSPSLLQSSTSPSPLPSSSPASLSTLLCRSSVIFSHPAPAAQPAPSPRPPPAALPALSPRPAPAALLAPSPFPAPAALQAPSPRPAPAATAPAFVVIDLSLTRPADFFFFAFNTRRAWRSPSTSTSSERSRGLGATATRGALGGAS